MILGGEPVTIKRKIRIHDGQGGYQESFESTSTEYGKCRPATGSEVARAAQLQQDISHVAYLQPNSVVAHNDRLVFGELELIVLAVRNPANASHHLEVNCKQIVHED